MPKTVNLLELNLANLQQLQNGAVSQQVQKLIAAAVADCEARPSEKRARKISIQLEVEPVSRLEDIDEEHKRVVLDGLTLRLNMDVKCPTRRTMGFDCGVGDDHALLFNPENPHNHRQAGLPLTFDGEAAETVPLRKNA